MTKASDNLRTSGISKLAFKKKNYVIHILLENKYKKNEKKKTQ